MSRTEVDRVADIIPDAVSSSLQPATHHYGAASDESKDWKAHATFWHH
jgi:hypothetical protein